MVEPGRVQSMGLQRVRHTTVQLAFTFIYLASTYLSIYLSLSPSLKIIMGADLKSKER